MKIEGKVAIITGSARGLGKYFAEGLLKRGAKVCICDILLKEGEKTAQEFKNTYGQDNVIFVDCDVTRKAEFLHVFDETTKAFGGFHIMINNAGVMVRWEDYSQEIATNLEAVIFGTFEAKKRMSSSDGGNGGIIINIASAAGLKVNAFWPVHHATKYGVVGFSRSYALALEEESARVQHSVRLGVLCPTYVLTPETKGLEESMKKNQRLKSSFEKCGGWTAPDKVVDALMQLVEDDNLNGGVLRISPFGPELLYPERLRDKNIVTL